jgi:ATP-dependent helicase/DNAse subunit B
VSVDRESLERLGEAVREGRGDQVLLLLPTHRLQAEARERLFAEVGLSGARRLGILSFYQFIRRILTAAGVRREPVDDALRRFILSHLLSREAAAGRLPRYAPLAASDGLAGAFSRLIGELKLAGVAPDDLEPVAGREAAHIYRVYQAFLNERGLADNEELPGLAREALQTGPQLLRGVTLLLDGFFDLTPIQAALLNEAARQAAAVEFVLPENDPRPELEAVPARVARLLGEAKVRRSGSLGAVGRGPELVHLDAELFRLSPVTAPPGEAVRLVPAGSPEAEVRWVAKEIKRLVTAEGARPDEIAVLLAETATYGPLLTARLTEEGIPWAQEAGEPLDRNPVVRAVLVCLEAALGLWTGFDLLKLVRSGYLPGDETHLAALRQVFRERGYQFSRAEWERRLKEPNSGSPGGPNMMTVQRRASAWRRCGGREPFCLPCWIRSRPCPGRLRWRSIWAPWGNCCRRSGSNGRRWSQRFRRR